MNFPDQLLPAVLVWTCNVLALLLLAPVAWSAPWRRLVGQDTFNLWLGMCVGLLLLWSIKAGIRPGLDFHLLGAMLLTLMFGARLAMLALAVVLLGVTLAGAAGWSSLGLNWLLTGALLVGLVLVVLMSGCASQEFKRNCEWLNGYNYAAMNATQRQESQACNAYGLMNFLSYGIIK